VCICNVTAEAAVDIISAIAPAVAIALKAVVNFILVPSPCGILEFAGPHVCPCGSTPHAKGFVPSVKIAGRYLAKASTDKQNLDLSVNVRPFVNILEAMARHSTAQ
jgi:hypothetical protein